MKHILILGAAGMAGHILYRQLSKHPEFKVTGTIYNTKPVENDPELVHLDVFDQKALASVLLETKPDVIINCIGSLIQESKKAPERTVYINAYLPHILKKIGNGAGAKIIHLSTDCVFSGKTGGYKETDLKDATDLYGMSKSLGEIIDDTNLTIRTSIIGPEMKLNGEGLFHWFMNNKRGTTINGYKSNYWSGVTTLELSKFIESVLINNPELSGLIHLTNNQKISKYDLLGLFNKFYDRGVNIEDKKDYACDKSFINTHPEALKFIVSGYEEMVREQQQYMELNSEIYPHYTIND